MMCEHKRVEQLCQKSFQMSNYSHWRRIADQQKIWWIMQFQEA